MLPRLTVSDNSLRLLSSGTYNCSSSLMNKIIESAIFRADLTSELGLGYYLAYHVFLLSDETSAVQQKNFSANYLEYADVATGISQAFLYT